MNRVHFHWQNIIFLLMLIFGLMQIKPVYSQYWGEMVLEKSFEREDFFFNTNFLNPYGIGNFAQSSSGLINNPFINLQINPAYLYSDSLRRTYVYMDFRSSHDLQEDQSWVIPLREYEPLHSNYLYPSFYAESRKALQPVFSGGILTRPLSFSGKHLFIGLTYQAIFQDEDYYAIPFDIYRSAIGYDYAGNRAAKFADMPIEDRYRGEDAMHQLGHFITFFAGLEPIKNIRLGWRLNRTIFNREGSYGSKNYWESLHNENSSSLWYNMENRDQDYQHTDIASGVQIQFSDKISLGMNGGYLWGDVVQTLTNNDSSFYKYGEPGQGDNWSYYWKDGGGDKYWKHVGNGLYGGLDLQYRPAPDKSIFLFYQYRKLDEDITLRANLSDTSYSSYKNTWDDQIDFYEYNYALTDMRSGIGTSETRVHLFSGAVRWQIEENKKLNIGVRVEFRNLKTQTDEDVLSNRHYGWVNSSPYNPSPDSYFEATVEDKILNWQFQAKRVTIQIPIFFTWKVSPTVKLHFGFNRSMSRWTIDDVTLARFHFRETTIDTTTVRKENFGERYQLPEEKRTDIKTTVLGGLTVSPSKLFNLRLLVVPNFSDTYNGSELSDLQWWVSLNLFP